MIMRPKGGDMETSRARPKRKRYFGMTAGQVAILAGMSAFICVVFSVAIVLLLDNSSQYSAPSPQPTYTPLPTYTLLPTYTPQSRFPPTWTPTPARLTNPATKPVTLPTNATNSKCLEFAKWLEITRKNIDTAHILNQRAQALNSRDSQGMTSISDGYAVLATNQSMVKTTAYTEQINKNIVESFNAYSLAWWDAGLAVISSSQRLLDQAVGNMKQAVVLLGSASKEIDKMKSSCGVK
jgi:hypothetical protein